MMCKRQIFSALVFGFVLAITGCGDDATSGGGTGGTAGSGGGNGAMVTSCDAICSGPCPFFGLDPNSGSCQSDCENLPDGNLGTDNCYDEMVAWGECANANNVCPNSIEDTIESALACPTEFDDWDTCNI